MSTDCPLSTRPVRVCGRGARFSVSGSTVTRTVPSAARPGLPATYTA